MKRKDLEQHRSIDAEIAAIERTIEVITGVQNSAMQTLYELSDDEARNACSWKETRP